MQESLEHNLAFEAEHKEGSEPVDSLVSEVLSSAELKEIIAETPDDLREKVLGLAIEFSILCRDPESVLTYLREIVPILTQVTPDATGNDRLKKAKTAITIDIVANQLAIDTDTPTDEESEQIFAFIRSNFITNGYYFHSFNLAFEDSIREKGLVPNERLWESAELDSIHQIGERVGATNLIGWGKINSENKISVANETTNIYRYARASPEWFAQFVAEGFHIPPNDNNYDKKAYDKKDYEAARHNIEQLCERLSSRDESDIAAGRAYPNLTADETAYILAFFEKYWQVFAGGGNGLAVALIDKSALGYDNDSFASFEESQAVMERIKGDRSLEASVSFLLDTRHNDLQIQENIAPEDLHIVKLPPYDEVHPHTTFAAL